MSHPVNLDSPPTCAWCEGSYRVAVDPRAWTTPKDRDGRDDYRQASSALQLVGLRLKAFGLTARPDAPWLVLVCDGCGHVALFRVKVAAFA